MYIRIVKQKTIIMKAIISQSIFKNWEKKDLWDHYYNLQLNPNKINNQILKIVIKEIKSR